MATITVYHEEENKNYTVTAELFLSPTADGTGESLYHLRFSTNMKDYYGDDLPQFVVRDLTDTPPGQGTATDFTELTKFYIDYYINAAELGQSSSSSSSSSFSSSSSSSHSSSSSSNSSSSQSSSSSSSQSSSSSSSQSSSSSSSSFPQVTIDAGGAYVLPLTDTRGVDITYTGIAGTTATMSLNGTVFTFGNVASIFTWDTTSVDAGPTAMPGAGDTIFQTVGLNVYKIVYNGTGSLLWSVTFDGYLSSSSSSSSSVDSNSSSSESSESIGNTSSSSNSSSSDSSSSN